MSVQPSTTFRYFVVLTILALISGACSSGKNAEPETLSIRNVPLGPATTWTIDYGNYPPSENTLILDPVLSTYRICYDRSERKDIPKINVYVVDFAIPPPIKTEHLTKGECVDVTGNQISIGYDNNICMAGCTTWNCACALIGRITKLP